MSGVLALDIATKTGWAWYGYPGAKIEWGSFQCAPKKRREKMNSEEKGRVSAVVGNTYVKKLGVILEGVLPDVLVFESPILPPGRSKLDTTRRLYGLALVTEMLCEERGLRCFEYYRPSILKETVGAGDADYPMIFKHLARQGFDCGKDKDAAMAMLILEFSMQYKLDLDEPRLWRFRDATNGKDDDDPGAE